MKIAIIDSGINAAHPHVRTVAGGVGVTSGDGWMEDTSDRLGHGTAVAAVIREKAPDADLYAIKVFDRSFFAHTNTVMRALQWCRHYRMDVVTLSIGMDDPHQRTDFESDFAGLLVIGTARQWPGCLPGVIPVAADDALARDEFSYRDGIFYASPRPRPATGFSLPDMDFAVANMTGLIARLLPSIVQRREPASSVRESLLEELIALGTPTGWPKRAPA